VKQWPKVALAELCAPAERYTSPTPGEIYRQLGVRLWGEGAYEREQIDGADTKYANFNRIEADDLVVNKIWARNGSVAVATAEQAGAYVSTEFPAFILNRERIDPRWMRFITKWRGFWTACDEKAQGTSGKNRIKPSQFLSIQIPLPPLAEQQSLVARLDALAEKTRQLEAHLHAAERDADRLLIGLATRNDLSDDERGAQGWQRGKLGDVLSLATDPISVRGDESYPNVGVLSFARGLFTKRPIEGTQTSASMLYRIRAGQFLYSRLFAFEGAYAIVGSEHDGAFVSNEFPTFDINAERASPEFLHAYFCSPRVWETIAHGSKGLGDRRQRVQPAQILKHELWLPPRQQLHTLNAMFPHMIALKAKLTAIHKASASLLSAALGRHLINSHCSIVSN